MRERKVGSVVIVDAERIAATDPALAATVELHLAGQLLCYAGEIVGATNLACALAATAQWFFEDSGQ